MVKKYGVGLAEDEQQELMSLVSKGRGEAAYKQTHARILPNSDVWARSDNRWGQDPRYRSDVMRFHEEWFEEHRHSLEPKVQNLVEREWRRLLDRMSELLVFE